MTTRVIVGSGIGSAVALAWATSLRSWMTHLAIQFGDRPRMTWEGTFGAVVLPAVLVGALIGFDWQRRREGGAAVPGVAWSPLLLVLGPALVADDFIATLLESGEGSGAIAVVAIGIIGGAAICGRGPVWARGLEGAIAVIGVLGSVVAFSLDGPTMTAADVFGGVHLAVLLVWLVVGCSLPLRIAPPRRPPRGRGHPLDVAADPSTTVARRS